MIRGPRRGLGTFRCTTSLPPRSPFNSNVATLFFWILILVVAASAATATSSSSSSSSSSSTTGRPFRPPGSFSGSKLIQRLKDSSSKQSSSSSSVATVGAEQQQRSSEESSISNTSILRLMSKNNLYIQSFPNGTISATGHDTGFYCKFSVLKRGAVDVGKMYIQGVVSKHYICINHCGLLYGSETLNEECILREQIESNWYNTYTSIKHSTPDKSLLMAFGTNGGSPCRLRMQSRWVNDSYSGGSKIELALGSKEKYAVFLPVTNISLPEGMNLTSLTLLNKRVAFMKNNSSNKTLGCSPRCFVPKSHQSSKKTKKHPTSKTKKESSSSTKRPKNHNNKPKCSCLSSASINETERCKTHCREERHKNHDRNGALAESNKASRPRTTPPSPLVLEEWRLQPNPTRKNNHRHPHKKKKKNHHNNHHPRDHHNKDRAKNPVSHPDELRTSGDIRLIRHMYRKIRAHPEMMDQLLLASGSETKA